MAPPFVAHVIEWLQSVLFNVTEIMYASRFWYIGLEWFEEAGRLGLG